MALPQSHILLAILLVCPLSPVPATSLAPQDIAGKRVSLSIHPTKATIHVGKKRVFKATVSGTQAIPIRWAVQEPNGGEITAGGIYTAPRHVGIYHVIATSEQDPAAKAVAKVTVVTEYDTPDWLRQRAR